MQSQQQQESQQQQQESQQQQQESQQRSQQQERKVHARPSLRGACRADRLCTGTEGEAGAEGEAVLRPRVMARLKREREDEERKAATEALLEAHRNDDGKALGSRWSSDSVSQVR